MSTVHFFLIVELNLRYYKVLYGVNYLIINFNNGKML